MEEGQGMSQVEEDDIQHEWLLSVAMSGFCQFQGLLTCLFCLLQLAAAKELALVKRVGKGDLLVIMGLEG